jgi:glutaconate CoA-transferase subunit A
MDKTLTLAELAARVSGAGSLAFGGGGLQRKPMAAACAIALSDTAPLHLVSLLGGPETDLLIGAGKASRLSFAYVGFDTYGLAPNLRKAREAGTLEVVEYSEATMLAAFRAAAEQLPFLPTRFALGTAITRTPTSPFSEITCPFSGETLLAVPALRPDVAIIHVGIADRSGNAVIHGDAYADPLLVRAADRVFVTAERVVDELPRDPGPRTTFVSRLWVHGVVEAPGGAGMTALFPEHPIDLDRILDYQRHADDPDWLRRFAREAR